MMATLQRVSTACRPRNYQGKNRTGFPTSASSLRLRKHHAVPASISVTTPKPPHFSHVNCAASASVYHFPSSCPVRPLPPQVGHFIQMMSSRLVQLGSGIMVSLQQLNDTNDQHTNPDSKPMPGENPNHHQDCPTEYE